MDEYIKRYNMGESTTILSKELGMSKVTFLKILRKNGVVIEKRKGFKTNPKLKTDFFNKIDTEEKAYILGLMYSDGNVMPYKSKKGIICSYKLRIRLQEKDQEILRKISKMICGDDLVKILQRNVKNWSDTASFQIGNMQLGKDLIRLGCPPNKSSIIKLPTYDMVPEIFYIHFLRGFYDGDGGITTKPPVVMSLTSNKNMCIELQSYFKNKHQIYFKDYYERKNGYGSIVMSGRDNCYKLYKLLYSDCSLYMERKRNTLINTIRMQRGNGRCPIEVLNEKYPIV